MAHKFTDKEKKKFESLPEHDRELAVIEHMSKKKAPKKEK